MDSTISAKMRKTRSSGFRNVRRRRRDGSTARREVEERDPEGKPALAKRKPAIALTVIALSLLGELGRVDEALAFTE
jgi:hypothetical protein